MFLVLEIDVIKHPLAALTLLMVCTWSIGATAAEPVSVDTDKARRHFPLVVSLTQEAIDLPMWGNLFTGPLHPGMAVGTEYPHVSGRYGRLFQTANLGFFLHANLDRVVYLNTEIGYGYRFEFGLGLESLVGLGYGHTFIDRQQYSLESGKPVTDWGSPSVLASLGLGLEYDLRAQNVLPLAFFVRYQPLLQFKVAPNSHLPVVPRIILSVGFKFYFSNGSNE